MSYPTEQRHAGILSSPLSLLTVLQFTLHLLLCVIHLNFSLSLSHTHTPKSNALTQFRILSLEIYVCGCKLLVFQDRGVCSVECSVCSTDINVQHGLDASECCVVSVLHIECQSQTFLLFWNGFTLGLFKQWPAAFPWWLFVDSRCRRQYTNWKEAENRERKDVGKRQGLSLHPLYIPK